MRSSSSSFSFSLPPHECAFPDRCLSHHGARAAAKHGIKKVSEELYEFLALAAQNRLRDVVDELGNISKQRLDFYKVPRNTPHTHTHIRHTHVLMFGGDTLDGQDEMKIEITSDPRKQLKLIEKREKEEKERRDAEEKERALKDKKMDPEKKKSDQARLEEEEKIRTRTANLTALQVPPLFLRFSFFLSSSFFIIAC